MGDFWGRDAQYYDYDGNYVNLGESFAPFTNAIKRQLTENNSAKNIVTMNAVMVARKITSRQIVLSLQQILILRLASCGATAIAIKK